jgi:uncharacterized LabA/DUF88 family protein
VVISGSGKRYYPCSAHCPEHWWRSRKKRGGTWVEKGIDVKLAVEMIENALSDNYGTAIIISADGDLVPAVELVKKQGKHVELALVQGQKAYHLSATCDLVIEMGRDLIMECRRHQKT